jgi:hypothetical protein
MPLKDETLLAMKEAAAKATPGPWKVYKTPFTQTELGRAQGFKEERTSVVNAIGQAWDHPQLKAPLPIITTTHGPYYDPQHAVKIEDEDAEFIAICNPANVSALIEEVERQAREIERVIGERNELNEEIETCHDMLDQYYHEDPAMCSADTLEQRLKLHLDELRPVITDNDVNGGD